MRFRGVHHIDPTGIRWELAYTPWILMPWDILKSLKIVNKLRQQHPEWKHYPTKEMIRKLPSKSDLV